MIHQELEPLKLESILTKQVKGVVYSSDPNIGKPAVRSQKTVLNLLKHLTGETQFHISDVLCFSTNHHTVVLSGKVHTVEIEI